MTKAPPEDLFAHIATQEHSIRSFSLRSVFTRTFNTTAVSGEQRGAWSLTMGHVSASFSGEPDAMHEMALLVCRSGPLLHDHETVKDTLCGGLQAAISGTLLASKRAIMLLKMDWHSSANRALLC